MDKYRKIPKYRYLQDWQVDSHLHLAMGQIPLDPLIKGTDQFDLCGQIVSA